MNQPQASTQTNKSHPNYHNLNPIKTNLTRHKNLITYNFSFCRLRSYDWPIYKSLRLESLTTDPYAFIGKFQEESLQPPSYFSDQLERYGPYPMGIWTIYKFDQCVGYAILAPNQLNIQSTATIFELYILPAFRKNGHSQKLINFLIDKAKASGFQKLVVQTTKTNTLAKNIYLQLGFKLMPPDFIHDNFTIDNNLDSFVLAL